MSHESFKFSKLGSDMVITIVKMTFLGTRKTRQIEAAVIYRHKIIVRTETSFLILDALIIVTNTDFN